MAKTTPQAVPVESKVTFQVNRKKYEQFKRKCKKAGISASQRLRELIALDVKA